MPPAILLRIKNIVNHGLASKCEVGLAYVIGQPRPLMQTIETFGTETVSDKELYAFKDKLIDTAVKSICDTFDLHRPIFIAKPAPTATLVSRSCLGSRLQPVSYTHLAMLAVLPP